MKTKDKYKKSRDPSPGSLLSPPSPQGEGPDEIVRENRSNTRNTKIVGTNSISYL